MTIFDRLSSVFARSRYDGITSSPHPMSSPANVEQNTSLKRAGRATESDSLHPTVSTMTTADDDLIMTPTPNITGQPSLDSVLDGRASISPRDKVKGYLLNSHNVGDSQCKRKLLGLDDSPSTKKTKLTNSGAEIVAAQSLMEPLYMADPNGGSSDDFDDEDGSEMGWESENDPDTDPLIPVNPESVDLPQEFFDDVGQQVVTGIPAMDYFSEASEHPKAAPMSILTRNTPDQRDTPDQLSLRSRSNGSSGSSSSTDYEYRGDETLNNDDLSGSPVPYPTPGDKNGFIPAEPANLAIPRPPPLKTTHSTHRILSSPVTPDTDDLLLTSGTIRRHGWPEDTTELLQKLHHRGHEPLLPAHWSMDFPYLPAGLFCPLPPLALDDDDDEDHETAYIRSLGYGKISDFHATKALGNLIHLPSRARDLLRAGVAPEKFIEKAIAAYFTWAYQDTGLDVPTTIPRPYDVHGDVRPQMPALVLTYTAPRNADPRDLEAIVHARLWAVRMQWRTYLARVKTWAVLADEPLSPTFGAEEPTVYAVAISHTTVAVLAHSGADLRQVGHFDLGVSDLDVWNALALAMVAANARNMANAVWEEAVREEEEEEETEEEVEEEEDGEEEEGGEN